MYVVLTIDESDEAEQEDEEDQRAEEDDENMSCPDTSIQELAARATAEVATATGRQRRQKVNRPMPINPRILTVIRHRKPHAMEVEHACRPVLLTGPSRILVCFHSIMGVLVQLVSE